MQRIPLQSWVEINTYRMSSTNPRVGVLTGTIFATNNGSLNKIVKVGTYTNARRIQIDLYDVLSFNDKYVTTDADGACALSGSELPFCYVAELA